MQDKGEKDFQGVKKSQVELEIQKELNAVTLGWGIEVSSVEM
jgi:hypothetical protein